MYNFRADRADPVLLEDAFGRLAAGCGMGMGLVDAMLTELQRRDPHRYTILRRQRRQALDQIAYAFAAYDASHGQRGDGPAARAFRERWLAHDETFAAPPRDDDAAPVA